MCVHMLVFVVVSSSYTTVQKNLENMFETGVVQANEC